MTETKTTVRELIEKLKEFDQDARVVACDCQFEFFDIEIDRVEITADGKAVCVAWHWIY